MNWEIVKSLVADVGVVIVGVGALLALIIQVQTIKKLRAENNQLKRKQVQEMSAIVRPTAAEITKYSQEARQIIRVVRASKDNLEHFMEPRLPNGDSVPFRRLTVAIGAVIAVCYNSIFALALMQVVRFHAAIALVTLFVTVAAVLAVSVSLSLGITRTENLLTLWLIAHSNTEGDQALSDERNT